MVQNRIDLLSPQERELIEYLADGVPLEEYILCLPDGPSPVLQAILQPRRRQSTPDENAERLQKRLKAVYEEEGEQVGVVAVSIQMESAAIVAETTAQEPPHSARFLLLLVPKKDRDGLVGDLEAEFLTLVLPKYGPRISRLWYWEQVIVVLAHLVWVKVKWIAGLVVLWKAVK